MEEEAAERPPPAPESERFAHRMAYAPLGFGTWMHRYIHINTKPTHTYTHPFKIHTPLYPYTIYTMYIHQSPPPQRPNSLYTHSGRRHGTHTHIQIYTHLLDRHTHSLNPHIHTHIYTHPQRSPPRRAPRRGRGSSAPWSCSKPCRGATNVRALGMPTLISLWVCAHCI